MPVDFPLLTAVGTTAMSVAVADAVASLSMGAVKGATHGVSLIRLSYLGFRHNPFYIRAFVDSFACAMPVKSMTRAMKGPTPYKELL